jgi:hypothetical protein
MEDPAESGQQRTVPVTPTIHVETFATHYTVTWKANGLVPFIKAARDIDTIPPSTTVVTDSPDVAGRQQHELPTLDCEASKATFVSLQPPWPWTLSWERRTWPVVSASGTPSARLCRDIHQATTDCSRWDDSALAQLERMTASVR